MEKNSTNNNHSLKVALIGNPNCGKSTLFNILTGLHQSTANFPGATVDKKTGSAKISDASGRNVLVEFLDLPGAYSLNPKSLDEKIAVELLQDRNHYDHPNLTLFVADASNLKRSLYLAAQIIDLKIPVVIALNMMDVVEKRGMELDDKLLAQRLGVKIVPISARQAWGIDELKQALISPIEIQKKDIEFKEQSDNVLDAFAKIPAVELATLQTNFVRACGGHAPKAASKTKPVPQEGKKFSVETVRQKYPNAYRPWSKEDDVLLTEQFTAGESRKKIAEAFGRQQGAIRARLVKLRLIEE